MGLLPAVLAALSLTATLNQVTTNGLSLLGTLSSDLLPKYLTDSPFPFGYPWGQRNCTNTNPYVDTQTPDTGITRTYNFTISRGILSPDGYEKQLILVNNQFPGPTIQANWGDTIIVNVRNNIFNPVEGTSIHWHGFLQHKTQWMDGTPGKSPQYALSRVNSKQGLPNALLLPGSPSLTNFVPSSMALLGTMPIILRSMSTAFLVQLSFTVPISRTMTWILVQYSFPTTTIQIIAPS